MKTTVSKPRYSIDLPIQISGKSTVRGTLVNLSKTGAKIKFDTDHTRCLDSYMSFYIYLDGIVPSYNAHDTLSIGKSKETFEDNSNRLKIVSKIIRFANEESDNCWGVEIVPPEGADKVKFHRLLTELEQKSTQEIALEQGKAVSKQQDKSFTIKFRALRDLIDFLPEDLYDTFFIPTKKSRTVGTKTALAFVHPENGERLELTILIEDCGYPVGSNQRGVTCSFESVTDDLVESINSFVGMDLY